jgi:hypothetical protein
MFVSIVDPAWKEEDEEILEEADPAGDGKPATELEFVVDDVFEDDDDLEVDELEEDDDISKDDK